MDSHHRPRQSHERHSAGHGTGEHRHSSGSASTSRRERGSSTKLPCDASRLHKEDLSACRPLFADYLDLQKQIDLRDLSVEEVKGRWKSFVGKWNRGELAEGWYDPQTRSRAEERAASGIGRGLDIPSRKRRREDTELQVPPDQLHDEDEDLDGIGPALPISHGTRSGPAIPRAQDLQLREELDGEESDSRRVARRLERKADRQQQKDRLEELIPRADPGSRERQLEKRQATTAVNREFRDAKETGEQEIGDRDLMGGDEDGVEGFRAQKRARERQKNEREIRKEEILRAREAEREERLQVHRAKEEKTMEMLKALAKQRFGQHQGQ